MTTTKIRTGQIKDLVGGGELPAGTDDGDLLRWDDDTGSWLVRGDPQEFSQIVLTPGVAATEDIEGGLRYDSVTKAIYVCTSDE